MRIISVINKYKPGKIVQPFPHPDEDPYVDGFVIANVHTLCLQIDDNANLISSDFTNHANTRTFAEWFLERWRSDTIVVTEAMKSNWLTDQLQDAVRNALLQPNWGRLMSKFAAWQSLTSHYGRGINRILYEIDTLYYVSQVELSHQPGHHYQMLQHDPALKALLRQAVWKSGTTQSIVAGINAIVAWKCLSLLQR